MRPQVSPDAVASVIVAVNPHEHDLGAVMEAWAAQRDAGRYEVLVANNGSRPGLAAAHAAHRWRNPRTPVRLIPVARSGRAAMNNAGVGASSGELVLFVADDLVPTEGVIAAHRAFHEALVSPAAGVGSAYFPPALRADPFRRWLEDSGRLYGAPLTRCPAAWPADFFFVGHASMTRETFERIGRFDESFVYDLFDDDDYGRRLRALGLHTHFLPRALAWHDHPVTLDERITAIERLGEASRRYEERCAPPHSWTGLAQAPLHELEARREELRASRPAAGPVTGFEAWWMAELDCAFLRGYRHADADIAVSSRQAGAGG